MLVARSSGADALGLTARPLLEVAVRPRVGSQDGSPRSRESTQRAASRPSAMAQTTRLAPRWASPTQYARDRRGEPVVDSHVAPSVELDAELLDQRNRSPGP